MGASTMPRWLRYALLMLTLASTVQAECVTPHVTSQMLALYDACQALLIGERHNQPESPALFVPS